MSLALGGAGGQEAVAPYSVFEKWLTTVSAHEDPFSLREKGWG